MDCVPVRTGSGNGLFNECLCPDQRFKAVDGGDTFSVGVVAGTGEVIAWGRAFYGELPAEGASATKLATPEPCQAVSCGTNHVLALTISGRVVASGWNRSGQAAAPATVEVVPVPAVVKFPDPLTKIVAVAAGGMHSLAIDSCGQVWAWGCNAYGQLGVDSELEQLHTPTLVAFPHNARVAHIAAGWAHSALVSTTGEVFTFGWGLYNQLGHGSTQDEHRPVAVDALHGLESDIVQVACGTWHTAALTKSGDLYTWGWGKDGQLGPGASEATQVLPRVVTIPSSSEASDEDQDVLAVACGNRFTLALCRDGSVQWWGPKQASGSVLQGGGTRSKSPHPGRVLGLAAGSSHAILLLEAPKELDKNKRRKTE